MKTQTTHHLDIIAQPLSPTTELTVTNHLGDKQSIFLVREQPLTIYLNRQEIVTVMTMGSEPVHLVAGFLLNQQLVANADDIRSIHIDWTVNAAAVYADNTQHIQQQTEKRVVTSGCGQGTMFNAVMESATQQQANLAAIAPLSTEQIYALLAQLSSENAVYKQAGGVHSCALCTTEAVIKTVEDVGRHNAVDSLTGYLALEKPNKAPTIMYTTGRLTSEMVIKTAQMGLPLIISRSGATSMGVAVANAAGITLISRAKGKRFLVLSNPERINYNHAN